MRYVHAKNPLVKASLFMFIALIAFTSSAKAGLDYYKIFLGKKLLYERYVNKPLDLQNLPISAADASEMLTVYYFQCNAPDKTGSNRSIALKDEKGNIIKQWNFQNSQGTKTGMTIPVKELLQLQKASKSNALALYYTAEGRTEGMKLAFVQTAKNDVTYMYLRGNDPVSEIALQVISLLFKNVVIV